MVDEYFHAMIHNLVIGFSAIDLAAKLLIPEVKANTETCEDEKGQVAPTQHRVDQFTFKFCFILNHLISLLDCSRGGLFSALMFRPAHRFPATSFFAHLYFDLIKIQE